MYKDRDKQRQAVKEATQRYRVRLKGITADEQPAERDTQMVIPCDTPSVIPEQPLILTPELCKDLAQRQSENEDMREMPLVQRYRTAGSLTKERQVRQKGFNE